MWNAAGNASSNDWLREATNYPQENCLGARVEEQGRKQGDQRGGARGTDSEGRLVKLFGGQALIFNKAFVAISILSRGSLLVLVVLWLFFCTLNLQQHALKADWPPVWPLKLAVVRGGSVYEYRWDPSSL